MSFEHTNNLVSLPRRSGLEFSYCHFFLDVAVVVNLLSFRHYYVRFLESVTTAADKSAFSVALFALARIVGDVYLLDADIIEFLYDVLDLKLIGIGRFCFSL